MRRTASRAQHAFEARDADLVDPRLHVDHAGVVDQGGEASELGIDLLEHRHHLCLVADVGLHGDRRAAVCTDGSHHLVGGQRVARVVDRDRVAATCRLQSRRGADASAASGDQEHLVQNPPPARKPCVS
jgi:hypothetical protein